MFSNRLILCRICVTASILLLLPGAVLGQTTRRKAPTRNRVAVQTPTTSSSKATLDLAMYYYNSGDISGKAEQAFKKVLQNYERTPEYETAQYFLAAYYQRKFYLQQAKNPEKQPDWNGLKQSIPEYLKYTSKFGKEGKHTWLSDAFFNLALVYLRVGDIDSAKGALWRIKEASVKDPTIYIHQVVWSPQSQTVVDAQLSASQLADYTLSLVQGKDYYFDKAVLQLQKWAQAHR